MIRLWMKAGVDRSSCAWTNSTRIRPSAPRHHRGPSPARSVRTQVSAWKRATRALRSSLRGTYSGASASARYAVIGAPAAARPTTTWSPMPATAAPRERRPTPGPCRPAPARRRSPRRPPPWPRARCSGGKTRSSAASSSVTRRGRIAAAPAPATRVRRGSLAALHRCCCTAAARSFGRDRADDPGTAGIRHGDPGHAQVERVLDVLRAAEGRPRHLDHDVARQEHARAGQMARQPERGAPRGAHAVEQQERDGPKRRWERAVGGQPVLGLNGPRAALERGHGDGQELPVGDGVGVDERDRVRGILAEDPVQRPAQRGTLSPPVALVAHEDARARRRGERGRVVGAVVRDDDDLVAGPRDRSVPPASERSGRSAAPRRAPGRAR